MLSSFLSKSQNMVMIQKNSICIGEADAFQHIKIYRESKI
jgi:hypothetical protein